MIGLAVRILSILLALGLFLVACQPGSPSPTTPVSTPTMSWTDTPSPGPIATETFTPEMTLTAEVRPTFTETVAAPDRPEEAIFIQEPGPGSQVTSPIRVAGIADPTFEQNLVVRIVLDDGTELTEVPTTIQAEAGQRGPFEAEVPVNLDMQRNIFIQVYAASARDGGVTHLSSTGVIFSPGGPEDIRIQEPQPEQIVIFQPQNGGTVTGGMAHVEGFALASFEQTLLVEILDADGNVIGSEAVIVQAPDLGQPGPFSADIAYTVTASAPGRVVVRDPSPAFGGDMHLSSVEITLEP